MEEKRKREIGESKQRINKFADKQKSLEELILKAAFNDELTEDNIVMPGNLYIFGNENPDAKPSKHVSMLEHNKKTRRKSKCQVMEKGLT